MIDDFRGRIPERKRVTLDGFSPRPAAEPGTLLPEDRAYRPDAVAFKADQHDPGALPQPMFRTPEQVRQDDETTLDSGQTSDHEYLPGPGHHLEIAAQAGHQKRRGFKAIFRRPDLSKKQWVIAAVLAILLIGGGSVLAYKLTYKPQPAPVAIKKAPVVVVEKPKPILSPLSGLPVSAEVQARPVTGVMIENSTNARPQSGLDQASIVFEAIAEAGITRFLALYQDNYPASVGPVRSARPYYLDWNMAFDANYAHVGGSPDALARIKAIGTKDLDQFFNAAAYRRVSFRFAPHNVYTGIPELAGRAAEKGWTKSTFTPLVRKEKETPSTVPTARSIDFAVSGPTYNVHYAYDANNNNYLRSMGGAAHYNNETKAQLAPKVVIALVMAYSILPDGYHSAYQTTGSGQMFVFQDGVVTTGTWAKGQPSEQFVFKNAAGEDLALNPGQTWITVVGDAAKVNYQP